MLLMDRLLSRPNRWFSAHWGVAPFTLPAMASMVSGLLPHQHKLWRYWDNPASAKQQNCVRDTIAHDFAARGTQSHALTGKGFAAGFSFGFDNGFSSWKATGSKPQLCVKPGFNLLHTYEVHDYIADRSPSKQGVWLQKPWLGAAERRKRIAVLEDRLIAFLKQHPEHEVWVTSDHGEGISPDWDLGHGPQALPSDSLLHLPLVKFGPGSGGYEDRFVPQTALRSLLVTGEWDDSPVEIVWQWNRMHEPDERRFQLGQRGVS